MGSCDNTRLMRALRGEPTDGVPFWEVWFGMSGLAEHVLGHPVRDWRERVEFHRLMGWEHVSVATKHYASPIDYIPYENYLAIVDVISAF